MITEGTYFNGNHWRNDNGLITIRCAEGGCVHYKAFHEDNTLYTVTSDASLGQDLDKVPFTLTAFTHTPQGVVVNHKYGTKKNLMREWDSPKPQPVPRVATHALPDDRLRWVPAVSS